MSGQSKAALIAVAVVGLALSACTQSMSPPQTADQAQESGASASTGAATQGTGTAQPQ